MKEKTLKLDTIKLLLQSSIIYQNIAYLKKIYTLL